MKTERFNSIIEATVDRSLRMLNTKNDGYSGLDPDRLRGIKTLADISGVTEWEALRGVMVKHTMSIYDLIREASVDNVAALPVWQEKISDHINYLLFLEALVYEKMDELTEKNLANNDDPDRIRNFVSERIQNLAGK